MKVRYSGFMIAAIFLLVVASFSSCDNRSSHSNADHLLCHISVADITPEEPVYLTGFANRQGKSGFVGEARSTVEAFWGGTALLLNGAAGDVNPVNGLGSSTALADQERSKLGNAVTQATLSEDTVLCLTIDTDRIILPYRNRDLTPDRVREEVFRRCSETTEFITWEEDVKKWGIT